MTFVGVDGRGVYLDGSVGKPSLFGWVNSCARTDLRPNVRFESDALRQYVMVTRNIAAGSEILCDYRWWGPGQPTPAKRSVLAERAAAKRKKI